MQSFSPYDIKLQYNLVRLYAFRDEQRGLQDEIVTDIAEETEIVGHNTHDLCPTTNNCPIQHLPVELLYLIFAESLWQVKYVWKYTTTPVTLKRVCRQWESIICGSPAFWKNLVLHHHPIQELEDVLGNYFRFGKLNRLDVDISLYGELNHTYPSERMEPLHVIRDNFQNIESIVGHIHPTALYELFGKEYIYDMRTIHTLMLRLKDPNYTNTSQASSFRCSDSFQLATVRTLDLYNFGYLLTNSNVKSALPCLTRLFLKGDHPAYLLDHAVIFTILSVAVNLQELSWTPGQDLGEGLVGLHLAPIKLEKLTTMHVEFQPFSADPAAVVCALQIPSLAECRFNGCNLSMTNHETYLYQMVEYFISSKGNCIRELALDNLLVTSEDWKRYIRFLPNLQKLSTDGEVFADGFFQYLADDNLIGLTLPKLQCLTMVRRVFNNQELDEFVRFAKNRGHVQKDHAQLRTLQLACVSWGGPGRAEFQRLSNEYANLDWGENVIDLKPVASPRALGTSDYTKCH
ncbi:hypothetical protein Clacol_009893 [Clathrus columnatus]|uniref:F-box domain-containing protein n=1 Tax=Clathrus columnatus TaxID=1419009 RepID=A0AAV5AMH0_9AGAM|nr:hypothetical protein Clacol_009893 [Clathrus columnatus]